MLNPTYVLFYVCEASRHMHGFHLGTQEVTAKRLTEEKWQWYQSHTFERPMALGQGRVTQGVPTKLVALELEVNGKVVLRRDESGWTRAPQ